MFYRQKLIMAMLQSFNGELEKTDFQKYLFLYTSICQTEDKKDFEFVPYRFGCFSFQSYADIRSLEASKHIECNDNLKVINADIDYIDLLNKDDKAKIVKFKETYSKYKGEELIRYVYEKYPYYTLNSEIFDRVLPNTTKYKIKGLEEQKLYTIGYEGHCVDNYLNRLLKNNIKVVCDVRKNPLSRKYGFSKKSLQNMLNNLGIKYVHIPELGIVSDKRQELNSIDDYNKLFAAYEVETLSKSNDYIKQILELLKTNKRVALTCFEADYNMCHRTRVAKSVLNLSKELDLEHI